MDMISATREWLRNLLAPSEPDPNWTARGAYLEHLREGRTEPRNPNMGKR